MCIVYFHRYILLFRLHSLIPFRLTVFFSSSIQFTCMFTANSSAFILCYMLSFDFSLLACVCVYVHECMSVGGLACRCACVLHHNKLSIDNNCILSWAVCVLCEWIQKTYRKWIVFDYTGVCFHTGKMRLTEWTACAPSERNTCNDNIWQVLKSFCALSFLCCCYCCCCWCFCWMYGDCNQCFDTATSNFFRFFSSSFQARIRLTILMAMMECAHAIVKIFYKISHSNWIF